VRAPRQLTDLPSECLELQRPSIAIHLGVKRRDILVDLTGSGGSAELVGSPASVESAESVESVTPVELIGVGGSVRSVQSI
jgi:hypothetical protein